MEKIFSEYSKFLDKSGSHLSLQTLAMYINLQNLLSTKEKAFISDHLSECRRCSDSFNLVFDEDFELDTEKDGIPVYRQPDDGDEDTSLFTSEDGLVEIELTRLSPSDYNLRFLSLPSRLKNEKAALQVNSRYVVRVLSMDMDTIYIVHSETDIMNAGLAELVSLTSPPAVPVLPESASHGIKKNIYLYAAAAMVIIAASLFIYFALNRAGNYPNEPTRVITNLTPGQKPINESDTAVSETPSDDKNEIENNNSSDKDDYFAANTTLENFIGRDERGESKVEIISPSIGADIKMPIKFEWMTARKNMTLNFVILNNRNSSVYERLINGNELTIDSKLKPGLYYWKLESTNEAEAMGKFYVR